MRHARVPQPAHPATAHTRRARSVRAAAAASAAPPPALFSYHVAGGGQLHVSLECRGDSFHLQLRAANLPQHAASPQLHWRVPGARVSAQPPTRAL